MNRESGSRAVPVTMRPAVLYFVERMLMRREPLTREAWAGFAAGADAFCDTILRRMPIDDPASEAWDNRRR